MIVYGSYTKQIRRLTNMWFVSKKKYDAMVAERDKWDGIASEAVAQNGRLLT